jgi:hypothetical protein
MGTTLIVVQKVGKKTSGFGFIIQRLVNVELLPANAIQPTRHLRIPAIICMPFIVDSPFLGNVRLLPILCIHQFLLGFTERIFFYVPLN